MDTLNLFVCLFVSVFVLISCANIVAFAYSYVATISINALINTTTIKETVLVLILFLALYTCYSLSINKNKLR